MMKFVISNGMNVFYSDSRNVRRHIQDTGWDRIVVVTAAGTPVAMGSRNYDGSVNVTTYKKHPKMFEHDVVTTKLCRDIQCMRAMGNR